MSPLYIGQESNLRLSEIKIKKKCGNSSVGRAIPCQGIGRRFEPGFPLQFSIVQKKLNEIFG